MNSLQITRILSSNPYTSKYFAGTFPSDQIPLKHSYPYFIVVNTDAANKPGKHWVLIWMESAEKAEFFDSFARRPQGPILRFLHRFKTILYNNKPLQSVLSEACGVFVCLYAILRSRGYSHSKIVYSFSRMPFSFFENLLE